MPPDDHRLDTSLGDPYSCAESVRDLTPGEETPFGFSAESVRDLVLGEHHASLTWQETPDTFGPEHDSSQLSITLTAKGGLQFADQRLEARPGWVIPSDVTEEGFGCRDVIRWHADAEISTSGGALNELADVLFEVGPSGVAVGSVELPLAALAGSFTAELALPEDVKPASDASLFLHFGVTGAAMAGDLVLQSGELESLDGTTRSERTGEGPIAHFPSGTGCGPEYGYSDGPQLLRRTALADTLARLNAASPTQVASDHGGPGTLLQLHYVNSDDSACRAAPLESALLFPAQVELDSDDGSVRGTFGVDVVALPQQGPLTASASALSEDPATKQQLPAAFGILQPIALADYRASSVEFESGLLDGQSWGALRTYGLGANTCTGGDAGADAGAGDAGTTSAETADAAACAGNESTLLWGLRWGVLPSER
ncbi:MAG TPA: hypothetical protein VJU61_19575 [Polyangiaceae bacterium]|nr:hypothetical protein [Polyangiaceae bacterium]